MPLDRFYLELEHLKTTLIRWAGFDGKMLPSLRQLRVHYNGAAGFNLSAIHSLTLRSSCNQRLCIEKRLIHDEDLIRCLVSVPVPPLSHLLLVILGESTRLSKNFVLMNDDASLSDSGPPLFPNSFGSIMKNMTATCSWTRCRRDGAHKNQPKTATLSQSPPSTQLKLFLIRDTN